MSNVKTINAEIFREAAQQTGLNYDWNDVRAKGLIESGELSKSGKAVDLNDASVQKDLAIILRKTDEISKEMLIFAPSQAIPQRRIFQKQKSAIADVKSYLQDIPSTDAIYNRMVPYLKLPANSCQEGIMAQWFISDLKSLGFEVHQDEAHTRIECEGDFTDAKTIKAETGNVVGVLKGAPNLPSWHLSVHLDGTTPQIAPVPHVRKGDILKTTGDSILRGDDVTGIALGLEFVTYLQRKKIPHGNIYFTGLVAEEVGAYGARHIRLQDLQGDIGLVLDGLYDEVAYGGSDIWIWNLKVKGEAEHVSLAPQVVNAQIVAARIIAEAWKLNAGSSYHGNPETVVVATANESGDGYIDGQDGKEKIRSGNRVPNLALLSGQIRTKSPNSEKTVIEKMKNEVDALCKSQGARCEFSAELALPGFQDPSMMTVAIVQKGYATAGLSQPTFEVIHGGSNANFTYPKRGELVLMPLGGKKYHTTEETLDLSMARRTFEAMIGMALEVSQYRRVKTDR